jgi:hypothetical protein
MPAQAFIRASSLKGGEWPPLWLIGTDGDSCRPGPQSASRRVKRFDVYNTSLQKKESSAWNSKSTSSTGFSGGK